MGILFNGDNLYENYVGIFFIFNGYLMGILFNGDNLYENYVGIFLLGI